MPLNSIKPLTPIEPLNPLKRFYILYTVAHILKVSPDRLRDMGKPRGATAPNKIETRPKVFRCEKYCSEFSFTD